RSAVFSDSVVNVFFLPQPPTGDAKSNRCNSPRRPGRQHSTTALNQTTKAPRAQRRICRTLRQKRSLANKDVSQQADLYGKTIRFAKHLTSECQISWLSWCSSCLCGS